MKLELLNASVVVLAQQHNPTILHPSFLRLQDVVPADWEVAEDPISTPPFSVVKYANGLVFAVETNRFQVIDNSPPADPRESRVAELAKKYIRALPHVRYTAVGVNFSGFVESAEPQKALCRRFLKRGPWNGKALTIAGLGLRFSYPVSEGGLRVDCNSGTVRRGKDTEEKTGMIVNVNYHTDVAGGEPLAAAEKALSLYGERCAHFVEVTGTIFGLEA